ncbi:MAG: CopG family transcriptional regulator [Lachnospiraceae bacterium]|nr:CopG family transcriptional regulator [Lachnospiraceae bacterium]
MARTGRPKADKPLQNRVTVRFSDEEYKKLEKYAKRMNLTITQTIRKGVEELLESRR